jgi:hypothetical protein
MTDSFLQPATYREAIQLNRETDKELATNWFGGAQVTPGRIICNELILRELGLVDWRSGVFAARLDQAPLRRDNNIVIRYNIVLS